MTKRATPIPIESEKRVDQKIQRVFGLPSRPALDAAQSRSFPPFAIDMAIKIIDGEVGGVNLPALLAPWQEAEKKRRGVGGRPADISTRSMLIVLLMHALAYDKLSLQAMAGTLYFMSAEDRARIGLPPLELERDQWHRRLSAAHDELVAPIDPYPMPKRKRVKTKESPLSKEEKKEKSKADAKARINRHRKLEGHQRVELAAFREQNRDLFDTRQTYLDDFLFELNANWIRHVRDEGLLDGFTGDYAIDGTLTVVQGIGSNKDLSVKANSTNLEAGTWSRHGNHSGEEQDAARALAAKPGTKPKPIKRAFGFETDVLTTTVGALDMPDLVFGVNLHRPGATKEVTGTLLPRVAAFGFPRGTVSADRNYNNLGPESFHEVILREGYQLAIDYPKDELGVQASFESYGNGYLMVEGTRYLDCIPEDLINCVIRSKLKKTDPQYIDEHTLRDQLKSREDYQLKTFGSRDERGFQRYSLPKPGSYVAADPDTGSSSRRPQRTR